MNLFSAKNTTAVFFFYRCPACFGTSLCINDVARAAISLILVFSQFFLIENISRLMELAQYFGIEMKSSVDVVIKMLLPVLPHKCR